MTIHNKLKHGESDSHSFMERRQSDSVIQSILNFEVGKLMSIQTSIRYGWIGVSC